MSSAVARATILWREIARRQRASRPDNSFSLDSTGQLARALEDRRAAVDATVSQLRQTGRSGL